jgi:hypothetical protein
MADLQTRLREAMRTEAEQASLERLRPLRPLPERIVRRRARTRGWLVPAAAAMAIVTVIALVSVGVRTATSHPRGQTGPDPAGIGSVQPSRSADTSMPPYFAAFGSVTNSHGRAEKGTFVMVYSSATGDTLCTVRVPGADNALPGHSLLAAAGDDRHFVVEALDGSSADAVVRFWWLVVSANGRRVTVSTLTLPDGPHGMIPTDIALTADGSRLAVAWGTPPWRKQATGLTAAMQVVDLASGTAQTWTTRQGNIRFAVGTMTGLSWGTGDQVLGFKWSAGWTGTLQSGYYLLDTGDLGAGLLSHEVVQGWAGGRTLGWALLTGAAQYVIASVALPVRGKPDAPGIGDGDPEIVEFSVRTGQIVGKLYGPGPYEYGMGWYLFSADPSGRHLLVGTPAMARIDDGVYTPIQLSAPGPGHYLYVQGAW